MLVAARLRGDKARAAADPIHDPVPPKAAPLDDLWAKPIGSPVVPMPVWSWDSSGNGTHNLQVLGKVELLKEPDQNYRRVRKANDGSWLSVEGARRNTRKYQTFSWSAEVF